MQKVKMVLGKIIAISIISAILDIIFHALLAPTYNYDYPPSYFVRSGLFKSAAGISLLIIFFLLSIVFIYIQGNLPGKKLSKGIRFGLSFGGLWFIGVIGMSIFFGSPLLHEFLGGLSDCASVVILSVLLGHFTANDSPYRGKISAGKIVLAIIIIALFFIIGQYLAFILIKGTPYFNISGSATFIWTAALGLWAGVAYWLLHQGIIKEKSLMQRSLYFGGFIVGIDWLLFNLFVLLFVDITILDLIILSVLNIVSIIVGMFAFEILFLKKNAK
jgi:hypothetical protein